MAVDFFVDEVVAHTSHAQSQARRVVKIESSSLRHASAPESASCASAATLHESKLVAACIAARALFN